MDAIHSWVGGAQCHSKLSRIAGSQASSPTLQRIAGPTLITCSPDWGDTLSVFGCKGLGWDELSKRGIADSGVFIFRVLIRNFLVRLTILSFVLEQSGMPSSILTRALLLRSLWMSLR